MVVLPESMVASRNSWRHNCWIMLFLVALTAGLFLIPGPPLVNQPPTGVKLRARVLTVNDSGLEKHGYVLYGSQMLTVEILEGEWKGQVFEASNQLRAQMELDKVYEVGDVVMAVSPKTTLESGDVLTAQDHDRSRWTSALFLIFCLLLVVFGHLVGCNALLSFVFSCLLIWKALIPLILRGWPASWTILGAVVLLTAVIMYLVAGVTRIGICAFCGSIVGILVGLVTAFFFTRVLHINGAVLPYAQALLFSGYPNLDLRDIFSGAMILASSGAVMDLGMDISSGQSEVARHHPGVSRRELVRSGLRMGRNVVGTMTTTLLLAYSGGYITLLMMFAAQGSSPWDILNNPLVAAEVVKTLIGSFSLVLVAPATAFLGGWFFHQKAAEPPVAAPKPPQTH
jgi:uncharacterized membrane protein